MAPADQPVEWRDRGDRGRQGRARTIRYRPLATEADLRYLEWVTDNRARVDRMSRDRIGYIQIPDMEDAGMREFVKWWYPQVRKEAMRGR